jgi:hypothetical protein
MEQKLLGLHAVTVSDGYTAIFVWVP